MLAAKRALTNFENAPLAPSGIKGSRVVSYRQFRNTDPPLLVYAWNEALNERGAVRRKTSSALDRQALFRPRRPDPGRGERRLCRFQPCRLWAEPGADRPVLHLRGNVPGVRAAFLPAARHRVRIASAQRGVSARARGATAFRGADGAARPVLSRPVR